MADHQKYRKNAEALVDQVSLPFGAYRWSGVSGDFSGKGSGASMDFQDHRDYSPGDDPRHLNWQAYARSGNYVLKQYQEEVAPTVDLIMDLSSSMFVTEEKQQRSSELLYLLALCAQRSGAKAQVHLIGGEDYQIISLQDVYATRWQEFTTDDLKQSEKALVPDMSRIALRSGSMRIFISDLLFEADPNSLIRPLVRGNGVLFCFVPYTQSEVDPLWRGNYEFEDVESKQRYSQHINPGILDDYKTAYKKHFALWAENIQLSNSRLARIGADSPLAEALAEEAIPKRLLEYTA